MLLTIVVRQNGDNFAPNIEANKQIVDAACASLSDLGEIQMRIFRDTDDFVDNRSVLLLSAIEVVRNGYVMFLDEDDSIADVEELLGLMWELDALHPKFGITRARLQIGQCNKIFKYAPSIRRSLTVENRIPNCCIIFHSTVLQNVNRQVSKSLTYQEDHALFLESVLAHPHELVALESAPSIVNWKSGRVLQPQAIDASQQAIKHLTKSITPTLKRKILTKNSKWGIAKLLEGLSFLSAIRCPKAFVMLTKAVFSRYIRLLRSLFSVERT